MSVYKIIIAIVLVGVGIFVYQHHTQKESDVSEATTINFLIGHQPVSVFDEALNEFVDVLESGAPNTFVVETLTPSDVNSATPDVSKKETTELFESDVVQISSIPTAYFEDVVPGVRIYSAPFLFSTYEQLESFFASDAAQALLDDISANTPYEALAHTFSGGFYFVGAYDERTDLEGANVASIATDPLVEQALEDLGANVVTPEAAVELESVGTEATYTRVSALADTSLKSIIETKHRVLVTVIAVDDDFYAQLNPEQQTALRVAAQAAAEVERAASRDLADSTKSELVESGITVTELSEDERIQLRIQYMESYPEAVRVLVQP